MQNYHFFLPYLRVTGKLLAPLAALLLVAACGEVSYSAEEHVARSREAYAEGDLRKAAIEIKNALQQEPDRAEARRLLGEYNLELGKAIEAEAELVRAQELGGDPNAIRRPLLRAWLMQGKNNKVIEATADDQLGDTPKPALMTLRAQALLGEGRVEDAQVVLGRALALDPKNIDALVGMAWVEISLENHDGARQHLNVALEHDPNSARAWDLLGDLERDAGRLDEAEDAYGRALEAAQQPFSPRLKRALVRVLQRDQEGAEKDIEVLESQADQHPAVSYIRGLLAFQQQRYGEARTDFEQALAQNPNYLPPLLYLGATQYALENWQQAETYLTRYLKFRPESVEATRLLGLTRLRDGDSDRAERALTAVLERDPSDKATLAMVSTLYLSQGRTDEALQHLQQAIALEPDSPAIRARLGIALVQDGQREEGFDELDRAIELAPDASLRLQLAMVLERLRADEHQQALERIESLHKEEKITTALYHNLKGIAHFGMGDPSAAETAFREGMKAAPEASADLASNLVRLMARQGRQDEAKELATEALEQAPEHLGLLMSLAQLEAAANEIEKAETLLVRAVETHPQALQPHLALAEIYLRTSRPSEGVAVLREWSQQRSTGDSTPPLPPRWLYLTAVGLLATGDNNAAIDNLRQLRKQQPEALNVGLMLARLLLQRDDRSEAREVLEDAIEREPEHLESRLMLVALLTQEGELGQAAAILEPARSAHPNHPQVLARMGALAYRRGQAREAVVHLQRAAELAPDDRSIAGALAQAQQASEDTAGAIATLNDWLARFPEDAGMHLLHANLLLEHGREQDAIAAYRAYLATGQENVVALNNLAWLLRKTAPDEALRLVERAVERAPESGEILDTKGVIQLAAGDDRAAIETLRSALQLSPEVASIRLNLARALLKDGQAEAARTQLETLIDKHPNTPEQREAEQLIQQSE
jgi:putative PEP-CTERM system TPR-repeat lipoprotein